MDIRDCCPKETRIEREGARGMGKSVFNDDDSLQLKKKWEGNYEVAFVSQLFRSASLSGDRS